MPGKCLLLCAGKVFNEEEMASRLNVNELRNQKSVNWQIYARLKVSPR